MPSFDLELPATLDHLGEARRRLRGWLADEVPDELARNDLLAVAGEFYLHVVFRTGGLGQARVRAERGTDGVRLSVTSADDRGTVRTMTPPSDPLAIGATGRRLVEGCCDEMRVEMAGAATVGAECFRSVPSGRTSSGSSAVEAGVHGLGDRRMDGQHTVEPRDLEDAT